MTRRPSSAWLILLSISIAGSLECGAQSAGAAPVWQRYQAAANQALASAQRAAQVVTPAPEGVTDFDLREVFEPLVGDYGLTYSAKAQSLDGKRVRLRGYMVREPRRPQGVFMIAAMPVRIEDDGFCFFEDLPPATVHVVLPGRDASMPSPYVPGKLELVGTLELGTQVAADGRNSRLRLRLDPAFGFLSERSPEPAVATLSSAP